MNYANYKIKDEKKERENECQCEKCRKRRKECDYYEEEYDYHEKKECYEEKPKKEHKCKVYVDVKCDEDECDEKRNKWVKEFKNCDVCITVEHEEERECCCKEKKKYY